MSSFIIGSWIFTVQAFKFQLVLKLIHSLYVHTHSENVTHTLCVYEHGCWFPFVLGGSLYRLQESQPTEVQEASYHAS